VPNADVGVDTDIHQIRADNDAVVLCTGATWPRDLKIKGRDADGVHFAMEYLQVSCLLIRFLRQSAETVSLLAEHEVTAGLRSPRWPIHKREGERRYRHRGW
jgi:NADPH-dependent glutamate synthase beta subunit-like oxidoreductase